MEQKETFNKMVDDIQDYVEMQKELVKLEVIDKVSEAGASVMAASVTFTFYLLVFLFLSVALSLLAGEYFGHWYLGFAAISVLYMFIALVLNAGKNSWLKRKFANSFIKSFLRNDN